ncbi:MAG: hypothetical protein H6774_04095 [Pseudomonadales bacterium]|nr:hypothetical protein [Pseudomonadales bacterium]
MRRIHKNSTAHSVRSYVSLVLFLVVFVALFLSVWPNKSLARVLIFFFTCFYCIWGWMAHLRSNTLTKSIAIEYVVLSLVAGSALYVITL